MDVDEQVEDLLNTLNQRYTSGRRKLVAALQTGDGPLTIHQILDCDSSLAQSSVYRNLMILEEAGAVSRIAVSDEYARYELAESLTGHHHHLICTDCGDVTDFSLDAEIEKLLDKALHAAAKKIDFLEMNHRLDIVGRCGQCS